MSHVFTYGSSSHIEIATNLLQNKQYQYIVIEFVGCIYKRLQALIDSTELINL